MRGVTRVQAPSRPGVPSWRPDLNRDTMLLLGFVTGLLAATGWFVKPPDGLAYWEAGTSSRLYPEFWGQTAHGFLFYPPPVAQVSMLLHPLGWGLFIVVLMTATFGAMWYCAKGWSFPLLAIGLPSVLGIGPKDPDVFLAYAFQGNLQWILAALTIVALRQPAAWSLELVTKVTTAIGWWWHVLRGEWRPAALGAIASLAIVGISVVASPSMWADYVAFATRNFAATNPPLETFPVPLGIRLVTAVPVLIWGARSGRAWTVPVVSGWSLVALFGLGFLPFWVAATRLVDDRRPK